MNKSETEPMNAAARFFYEHAGYSYGPGETSEQGRERNARNLAACEGIAREAGVSFGWHVDECVDSSEWRDDCEPYAVWVCVAYDCEGRMVDSLGAIDFGPGGTPHASDYRRVVEAELAVQYVDETLEHATR